MKKMLEFSLVLLDSLCTQCTLNTIVGNINNIKKVTFQTSLEVTIGRRVLCSRLSTAVGGKDLDLVNI